MAVTSLKIRVFLVKVNNLSSRFKQVKDFLGNLSHQAQEVFLVHQLATSELVKPNHRLKIHLVMFLRLVSNHNLQEVECLVLNLQVVSEECLKWEFNNRVNLWVLVSVLVVASQADFLASNQHNLALAAFSKQVLVSQINLSLVFLVNHIRLSRLETKAVFQVSIKIQLIALVNKILE